MSEQPEQIQETSWYTAHGMVRTKAKLHPREPNDFYPTPERLCEQALRVLPGVPAGARILDPGCGTGVWGRAARGIWPDARIVGLDLHPQVSTCRAAYDLVLAADFLRHPLQTAPRFDLVIGNPPYALAEPFLRQALNLLGEGGQVLFLLRLAFLESQGRYRRLYAGNVRPAAVYVVVERPSFTGNNRTDATAYALFHWRKAAPAVHTELHWLVWRNAYQLSLFD